MQFQLETRVSNLLGRKPPVRPSHYNWTEIWLPL